MALPAVQPKHLTTEEVIVEAHRRAVTTSPAEIAKWMQAVFGRNLTALMSGVDNPTTITRWTRGTKPHPAHLARLRTAFQIASLIEIIDDRETAQAWFMGMNPILDHHAPASVLANEPETAHRVMGAAHFFLAHG